jgi:NAD(P)H dehydrogenase (quinone)
MAQSYCGRLVNIASANPIPFRLQNDGDYDDVQVLKPHLSPNATGHALHQHEPVFIANTFQGTPGDYTPRHFAPTSRDEDPPTSSSS